MKAEKEINLVIPTKQWQKAVEDQMALKTKFDKAVHGIDPNDPEALIKALMGEFMGGLK